MFDLQRAVYIDFESDNTAGLGLTYYHPNFKVTSASFIVDNTSYFSTNIDEVRESLRYFVHEGYTLVVYNASFDISIMKHVFGEKKAFRLALDAWRLFNYVCLTAGDKRAGLKRKTSLPAAVEYLFGIEDYKRPFLDKIIEMGLAKTDKEAHANIGQLPEDMLEQYNNLDTYYCKAVCEECIKRLDSWNINWKPDYLAFIREVELYSDSYVKGIRIDKPLLKHNIEELQVKIEQCDKKIRALPEVKQVEAMLNVVTVPGLSKVTINRWKKLKNLDKSYVLSEEELNELAEHVKRKNYKKFNMNSTKQKKTLFIDVMGFPVVKLTAKGSAGMSKKALKLYGDVGKLFSQYQNLTKQLEEAIKIDELSNLDGRLHPTLRSGAVTTGRSSSKF